jgi:hypothetical protein
MLLALLLPLLTPTQSGADRASDTRVTISINQDGYFEPGDRATVRVRSSDDGYLVVFRATTEGRVRILYPLDPGQDNFVRGGKTYEILGRNGKETFRVDDGSGSGFIYAAVAEDPFRFDGMVRGDHWDYRVLADYRVSNDPEAVFSEIVEKMAEGTRYQFDVLSYQVPGSGDYAGNDGYYYPHRGVVYGSWFGPCFGCPGYYGGSGFSVGLSFGSPWYYDPWYWDPWYTPYYYTPYYYRPYFASYPYYGNCYYGPCYSSGYVWRPGHMRPPYTFKPGPPVTSIGYRPRAGSGGGGGVGVRPRTGSSGIGVGMRPRARDQVDDPWQGRLQPAPRSRWTTSNDDGRRLAPADRDRWARSRGRADSEGGSDHSWSGRRPVSPDADRGREPSRRDSPSRTEAPSRRESPPSRAAPSSRPESRPSSGSPRRRPG